MFKPKFAPKVPPVKLESTDPTPTIPSTDREEGTSISRNDSKRIDSKIKGKKETVSSNNPRGNIHGGRGSHWIMPTGTAFFTGNAPAQLAAKLNKSVTIPVKGESSSAVAKKPSSSGHSFRIARPNEAIEEEFTSGTAVAAAAASNSEHLPAEPDLVDTDSDRSLQDEDEDSSFQLTSANRLPELWPPQKFSPLAPLSLPFGPKTPQLRKILANEPILAPPDDLEALDYEERTSLFLFQMPSDLSSIAERDAGNKAGGGGLVDSQGRLGKLQLLKSGKVKLLTNDGRSFDVNNGLAACFIQTLACVELKEGLAETTAAEVTEPSSHAKKKRDSQLTAQTAIVEQGDIHFLGNITRKVVITPNYELGIRRKRSSSTAPAAAAAGGTKAQKINQTLINRDEIVSSEEELLVGEEEEEFPLDSMMMDVAE